MTNILKSSIIIIVKRIKPTQTETELVLKTQKHLSFIYRLGESKSERIKDSTGSEVILPQTGILIIKTPVGLKKSLDKYFKK